MDMHRFKRVGPRTLRHLRGQWGSLGVFLLAVGVLGMVVRKEWRLLAITVPTGLLFLFFWSFYSYVKPRYVFSVQIFAYPVIAYGIHSVVLWTSAIVSASWVRKHVPIGSVIVALIALLAQLGTIAVRGNESLKVWQMPAIRRVFADVLEEPVVFDCARRRHTRLLASIFASRKSSLVNHWRHNSFSIHWGEVFAKGDLDTGLGDRFREILEDLAVHNIYDYGVRRLPVRYWLDRVPVIDLGTVAGRLDLYGRVMDDYLHKLEPWSHTSFSHSLEAYPVDEPLLLGLDFYRLWDYDDRTFWRVSAGGFTNDLPRKNHFIWQPLPVAAAREDLVIASDAGLPIDPHVAVFRLNDPITILFGVDGDYWYRNYLDVGFAENRHLMHASAILLMDQGRVQVPVFADEGHDVYMSLRVVFYQQEPFYGGRHHMQVSDGENRVQVTLPGRHVGADVYFPLGVGRGAFELRDIELRTSLPSMHKQIENRRAGKAQNFEYASISSMRIFALPRKLPARFVFRAEADYSPWVQDGIGLYGIETSEQGSFVWMKPEASIVLPAAKHEGVYQMSVTTVAHRPVEFPAEPQWVWNGVAVQPTRREPGAAENVTIYHFDAVAFRGADQNVLQVIANEWIPRRDSDIPDGRSLGIGFVEMAWQRSM